MPSICCPLPGKNVTGSEFGSSFSTRPIELAIWPVDAERQIGPCSVAATGDGVTRGSPR